MELEDVPAMLGAVKGSRLDVNRWDGGMRRNNLHPWVEDDGAMGRRTNWVLQPNLLVPYLKVQYKEMEGETYSIPHPSQQPPTTHPS